MATIRNINDRWGDPVTFEAPTVAEAVADMGACIASCGYALEGPLREGLDYEVVATRYAVMVRTTVDTWTTHSTWATRSEAQDQADYVGGRVVEVDEDQEDTTL